MKKSNLQTLAVVALAGCAASVAVGQGRTKPEGAVPLAFGGTITPAYIEYKGVRYPVSSPNTDVIQLIYENGASPFPGALGGYFLTTSLPRFHMLDQASFSPGPGQGAGHPLTSMFITISATTVTIPTDPLDVLVTFWDTLTPTATPATSNQIGATIRVGFNAPAAGWATNTVYGSAEIDLTTFSLTSADDLVYIDLAYVTQGGTSPANAHPWASGAFYSASGAGNTVGSSPPVAPAVPTYWRDANGNGAIDAGEERTFAAPNVANFAFALKGDAGPIATGGCCLPDGTCTITDAVACTAQGGTYRGDNTDCLAPCPQPGGCCLIDGTCTVMLAAKCNSFSGSSYRGDSTNCVGFACVPVPGTLYTNGNLATGGTSGSGVPAPGGGQWSEVQADSCTANTNAGYNTVSAAAPAFRIADDFVVPAGGWNIKALVFPAYRTGSSPTQSPFASGTIQIWNGPPNVAGSVVVFGDATTNRLGATPFSDIYRCFNTTVGLAVPDATRPIFNNWFNVNTVLPAGTYWMDVQLTGAPTNGGFAPSNTELGVRTTAGANAIQMTAANTWAAVVDSGITTTCGPMPQDFPFVLRGSGSGSACYANCDGSTQVPCLNVLDFGCFLNKFAASDTYANCDNSTQVPILNVLDFGCFLNRFAAGCSSC